MDNLHDIDDFINITTPPFLHVGGYKPAGALL